MRKPESSSCPLCVEEQGLLGSGSGGRERDNADEVLEISTVRGRGNYARRRYLHWKKARDMPNGHRLCSVPRDARARLVPMRFFMPALAGRLGDAAKLAAVAPSDAGGCHRDRPGLGGRGRWGPVRFLLGLGINRRDPLAAQAPHGGVRSRMQVVLVMSFAFESGAGGSAFFAIEAVVNLKRRLDVMLNRTFVSAAR